jgi:hypothetical protein
MSFSSSNFEIWGCLVNFGFENIKENRFPFLPGHPVASTPTRSPTPAAPHPPSPAPSHLPPFAPPQQQRKPSGSPPPLLASARSSALPFWPPPITAIVSIFL